MKKSLALSILMSLMVFAYCQTPKPSEGNHEENLEKLLKYGLTEKPYLHLDRTAYALVDTIFFKAYVTIGDNLEFSKLSGVLYVDLSNSQGEILKSLKLQLVNGLAAGDFNVNNTFVPGFYKMRAYTKWSGNMVDPNYFERLISIGNSNTNAAAVRDTNASLADLQFFPEGGNLISKVKSKIAFKAINSKGLGTDVSGTVMDEEDAKVIEFSSTHLGMGYFTFTPEAGHQYRARIRFKNGTTKTIKLPLVHRNGIGLHVQYDSLSKVGIEVQCSPEYLTANLGKQLHMNIISAGYKTVVNANLEASSMRFDLQTRFLHSGICRIILNDENNNPLSERLVFIKKEDLLKLDIVLPKTVFTPREKVEFKINVKDKFGNNADGSYSLSVIDAGQIKINENAERTILTNYLLTGDLRGYIENPNQYFSGANPNIQPELDLVMLTHGFRRYSWKPEKDSLITFQPEKYLQYQGTLLQGNNIPLVNSAFTLIPAMDGPIFNAKTDAKGRFSLNSLIVFDTVSFYIKAEEKHRKKELKTVFRNDTTLSAVFTSTKSKMGDLAGFETTNTDGQGQLLNQPALAGGGMGRELKEVSIKGTRIQKSYRTLSYAGANNASQVIQMNSIQSGGTLESILNGRLRNVTFQNGTPYSNTGSGRRQMLFVVDGAIIPNIKGFPPPDVNNFLASDVKTVEVLSAGNASIYGMDAGAGVIIITTKQGNEEIKSYQENTKPDLRLVGFHLAREFYSPRYNATSPNATLADYRKTVFWQPNIVPDKNGDILISYYNTDGKGEYRIVIEGIDNKGNLGRKDLHYKVN
jgi:hypothetical protein